MSPGRTQARIITLVDLLVVLTDSLRLQTLFSEYDYTLVNNSGFCYDIYVNDGDPMKDRGVWVGEKDFDSCKLECNAHTSCPGINWNDDGTFQCFRLVGTLDNYPYRFSQSGFECWKKEVAGSIYGDPHSKNMLGEHFDIRRTGNYNMISMPKRPGEKNLTVNARIISRGHPCSGLLYITGLELTGKWFSAVGGSIKLYTETEMFNAPATVGLKLGTSTNMSLQDFDARVPKEMMSVSRYSPQPPTEENTHVNTLMLQFHLGKSTVKVGWSHEKLNEGFTNWMWFTVAGLGNPNDVGGLLGSDEHLSVQLPPENCRGQPSFHKTSPFLQGFASVDA